MATLSVQFAHPQITVTRQLTVTDAKMAEFAALLVGDYGPDADGQPLSNAEAVARFADGMIESAKDNYRRMAKNEDVAAIATREIDA